MDDASCTSAFHPTPNLFKPCVHLFFLAASSRKLHLLRSPICTNNHFAAFGVPGGRFGDDDKAGHGTHTAGTAAGSTLNSPAETTDCETGKTLSCAGACIDTTGGSDDDLVSYYYQVDDIDRICPFFGCDDSEVCLGDDVGVTLAENGGMAQGAKLAVFDIFAGETSLGTYAGNGLWEPCLEAGCKIHSNSWGFDGVCLLSALDILYDDFMYQVCTSLKLPFRVRFKGGGCTLPFRAAGGRHLFLRAVGCRSLSC